MTLRAVPSLTSGRHARDAPTTDPLDAFAPEGAHVPGRGGLARRAPSSATRHRRPVPPVRWTQPVAATATSLRNRVPAHRRACFPSLPAASWRSSCSGGRSRPGPAPRTGRLRARDPAAGRSVEIDGQPRGTTPLAVDLAVGTHTVRLRHEAEERTLSVNDDRRRPDVAVSRAGGAERAGSPGGAPHDRQRAAWRAGVDQRRGARRDAGDGPRSRGHAPQGHRGRRDGLERADRRRRTRRHHLRGLRARPPRCDCRLPLRAVGVHRPDRGGRRHRRVERRLARHDCRRPT